MSTSSTALPTGGGRLAGKSLLVVGGGAEGPPAPSEGLAIGNGRAVALLAAGEGASVAVADLDLAAAEATADRVRRDGGTAVAIQCDVRDEDACRDLVERAIDELDGLNLLVNNVGLSSNSSIIGETVETFDLLVEVNLRGHFLVLQNALQHLVAAGGGSVVTMSSVGAIRSGQMAAYEATKAALLGLSRSAAVTAARGGVRVNTVLPGFIDSAMFRREMGDVAHAMASGVPLGRPGTPWDVARAALFLLSDESAYVTGLELVVDGGLSLTL